MRAYSFLILYLIFSNLLAIPIEGDIPDETKPIPKPITHPVPQPTDPRICTASEKQLGYCYLIYKPVCGVYINQQGQQIKQTFTNRCVACKTPNIQYIYDRPCSSYPANSQFCIPHPGVSIFCSSVYKPVCGYYNNSIACVTAPCASTFKNSCYSCLYDYVEYYLPGTCYPTKYDETETVKSKVIPKNAQIP